MHQYHFARYHHQGTVSTDMEAAANNRRSFYSYGYSSSSDDEVEDNEKENRIPRSGNAQKKTKANNYVDRVDSPDDAHDMKSAPTTASTHGTSSLVVVATVLEEEQQHNLCSTKTASGFETLPSPMPPPLPTQTTIGTSSGETFILDGESSIWNPQFGFQDSELPISQSGRTHSNWNNIDQDPGQRCRNNHIESRTGCNSCESPNGIEKNRRCCRRPEWCRRRYYRRSCQLYNGAVCCPNWLICVLLTIFLLGFALGSVVVSKIWNDSPFGSRVEQPPLPPSNITVGVYYYPWHNDDFHRGQGYLREQLMPPQQPTLGEYDDTDSKVISQHLAWSRQANVRLWVTSVCTDALPLWYGVCVTCCTPNLT